jgi:hypothetical protein
MGCKRVNWIQLAQDMAYWRAFVYVVKNLWVFIKAGNFLTT